MDKKLKIAFDVDDTLIVPAVATGFDIDVPNYETIAIYRWFQAQGNYMIIWSGGGKDYAERWAEKLGLTADEILAKDTKYQNEIDIAFDDSDIKLAKTNVKVKRLNNKIIRYPEKISKKE
jgi:phosphoserine phosphatase